MTTATETSATTIHLTPIAKAKLDEYLGQEPSETCVRILVEDDGRYGLSLDTEASGDTRFPVQGIPFVIEAAVLPATEGLRIDYLEQGASSGFSLTGGKQVTARKVLRTETTPNPNAMKFVLSFSLGRTSRTWKAADKETFTPVVAELFAIDGVEEVFELDGFVTITRRAGIEWETIIPRAKEALAKLEPPKLEGQAGPASDSLQDRIEWFIRSEVAPFLQQDGGDIDLLGVENGTVKVRLVGSCGTCPSSMATLQFGVEKRLKDKFKEVQKIEVVNPPGGGGHHHGHDHHGHDHKH